MVSFDRSFFTRQETFTSAMTRLVMCAGDVDTDGAVAWALMGALYGYKRRSQVQRLVSGLVRSPLFVSSRC